LELSIKYVRPQPPFDPKTPRFRHVRGLLKEILVCVQLSPFRRL